MMNPLVDRDAGTHGKNQNGDNKTPKIDFLAVTERELIIRRHPGPAQPVK